MIHPDYKSGKSLHEQIEEKFKGLIISGAMKPHEPLPSVREMAVSLTVNPNTVQRAYKQLEQDGFIYSIKGKGSFVAEAYEQDGKRIGELLDEVEKSVRELAFLGAEREAVLQLIEQIYDEQEGSL